MNNNIAIYTQGLIKSYGPVRALRGVDLEVHSGEIFGFLGPNGAGKTTTIRCLLDLIRPNGGTVRVLGLNPQAEPVKVKSLVGYLPGELRFDENLTVLGTIKLFKQLRNDHADWDFINDLATRLDLDLKMPIRNLSKGNKQKLGVLQAMMHKPPLLVFDEPTFGLDPVVQQEVLRLIVEARAEGSTVFFSSHILSEVHEIAERVGIIRQGRVVEVAETANLINRSLQRVRILFKHPIDYNFLNDVPGVTILLRDGEVGVLLQVEGEMDQLIKALATLPVRNVETERPSLEEIFLAYYKADQASM